MDAAERTHDDPPEPVRRGLLRPIAGTAHRACAAVHPGRTADLDAGKERLPIMLVTGLMGTALDGKYTNREGLGCT